MARMEFISGLSVLYLYLLSAAICKEKETDTLFDGEETDLVPGLLRYRVRKNFCRAWNSFIAASFVGGQSLCVLRESNLGEYGANKEARDGSDSRKGEINGGSIVCFAFPVSTFQVDKGERFS